MCSNASTVLPPPPREKFALSQKNLDLYRICHKLIRPFTPQHNGKVGYSHRKDNEYFHVTHLFYYFANFCKTMEGVWLQRLQQLSYAATGMEITKWSTSRISTVGVINVWQICILYHHKRISATGSMQYRSVPHRGGIIRMRSYMIILCICQFFYCCVKLVLFAVIMLINKAIFQCIDIFFIGELPYGYPVLLMLKVIPRFLQNFANSFVVHWLPKSECARSLIRNEVLFAKSMIMFLAAILEITLCPCKFMIV